MTCVTIGVDLAAASHFRAPPARHRPATVTRDRIASDTQRYRHRLTFPCLCFVAACSRLRATASAAETARRLADYDAQRVRADAAEAECERLRDGFAILARMTPHQLRDEQLEQACAIARENGFAHDRAIAAAALARRSRDQTIALANAFARAARKAWESCGADERNRYYRERNAHDRTRAALRDALCLLDERTDERDALAARVGKP